MRDPLRTRLCELLGIERPVLQSGMARVAGPVLVAAVSNAGGLGILAGLGLSSEELRSQIRDIRRRTDRPFGVNLWLHPWVQYPGDPASLSAEHVRAVQTVFDRLRAQVGLAPSAGPIPPAAPALIDEALDVILEEKVPVWSIALGVPTADQIARCRAAGVRVSAMAASVEDASTLAAAGVDVIVAQGAEAGGHVRCGRRPWRR